jgi:protein-S-isoprenylcysteine O-methyltransferase Ste14
MMDSGKEYSMRSTAVSIAGIVVLNTLIVSAPLALVDRARLSLTPFLLLVAGSSVMCIAELRHTAQRTESLKSFGAYQFAALVGSLLFLFTQWSSLTEFLLGNPSIGDDLSMATGSALVFGGGIVRSLSLKSLASGFCSETTSTVLVTNRIYAILRHPSETGLLLASLGFTVMLSAWQTAMILLPIALVFSIYRMRLEEHCLLASFGAEYSDYCRRAGRWIPNLRCIQISS